MWITLAAVLSGAQSAAAANGDLDPSFSGDGLVRLESPDGIESAAAVEPLPDGGALVAGSRGRGSMYEETSRSGVVFRLAEDGSIVRTYGTGGEAVIEGLPGVDVTDVALAPDGGAFVAGVLAATNGFLHMGDYEGLIARLTPDGQLDPSFAEGGILAGPEVPGITSLEIDADERILAAAAETVGGASVPNAVTVLRVTRQGELDSTYSGDGMATQPLGESVSTAFLPQVPKADLALDFAGRAVVSAGTRSDLAVITRFDPDGRSDPTFGTEGQVRVRVPERPQFGFGVSAEVRSDGRIVFVTDEPNGPYASPVANYAYQLGEDGSVDEGFTTRLANLDGADAALGPAGHLIVAGMWRTEGADSGDFGLAVVDPEGGLSQLFGDAGLRAIRFDLEIDEANAVALDAHGRLVLAGRAGFRFPRTSDFALARLETTTGPPDQDGDDVLDPDDECFTRFGPAQRNGCPTYDRSLRLDRTGSDLEGTIDSSDTYCASSGAIQLLRKRPGRDAKVGTVTRLPLEGMPRVFGHRFDITGNSPRSLQHVYAKVRRTSDPAAGRCRGERAPVKAK